MEKNFEQAKNVFQNYIQRFFVHPLSNSVSLPEADLFVIIPSYGEENLEATLQSLADAQKPEVNVCILVVINHKKEDNETIKQINQDSIRCLDEFAKKDPALNYKSLPALDLTDKNAGVGLARKIGMDAILLSCLESGRDPVLVCLDGDCSVSEDYFRKIENGFISTSADVATLEFRHTIKPEMDPDLKAGIAHYELFLEYYRLGLQKAGFPFCSHTVGSSMACKLIPYAKSGGMNQRKAGEDFYFLHKLFPHYQTTELEGPLVFPSPRISTRVPFGTGRFQQQWKSGEQHWHESYSPWVFSHLAVFLQTCIGYLEEHAASDPFDFRAFEALSQKSGPFLEEFAVAHNLAQIQRSSPRFTVRKKAFFRWFDGLKALRFVHYFNLGEPHHELVDAVRSFIPEIGFDHQMTGLVPNLRKYLQENPGLERKEKEKSASLQSEVK